MKYIDHLNVRCVSYLYTLDTFDRNMEMRLAVLRGSWRLVQYPLHRFMFIITFDPRISGQSFGIFMRLSQTGDFLCMGAANLLSSLACPSRYKWMFMFSRPGLAVIVVFGALHNATSFVSLRWTKKIIWLTTQYFVSFQDIKKSYLSAFALFIIESSRLG